MGGEIHYQIGVPEELRGEAAELYDEAFGAKFALAVPEREKRLLMLAEALALPYAVALISGGRLAGLAGFSRPQGSLTGGMSASQPFQHLGLLNGFRAAAVFSLYERQSEPSQLLMDGITVHKDQRGQGIGTHLLNEIKQYGRDEGYASVRLDVIDTNPGARRLYEREGFVATKTEHFGYLRRILGFGAATTMVYKLADEP